MLIHIIGGGNGQLSLIRRCKSRGLEVLITDQSSDAPGIAEADFFEPASTFSTSETVAALKRFRSEQGRLPGGIAVAGTDQPVLTAAETAEALGIGYFLDRRKALTFTNKKVMKNLLRESGIAVSPYVFFSESSGPQVLDELQFPVVVKPLDSQGQRGVLRLDSPSDVAARLPEVLSYSRQSEILAEEYYPSEEVTVSGWVCGGELYIFSVTDRRTVDFESSIGVCLAHHYPSRLNEKAAEIASLSRRVTEVSGIEEGPVYFQFLYGRKGLVVNEIAARLGGAYEDQFLPFICGVDTLDLLIDLSLGLPAAFDFTGIEHSADRVVSLQMFFCREGLIGTMSGMDSVLKLSGVRSGGFLVEPGTLILPRANSVQRAGYFLICCDSKRTADQIAEEAYSLLEIRSNDGENMIDVDRIMFFGGRN